MSTITRARIEVILLCTTGQYESSDKAVLLKSHPPCTMIHRNGPVHHQTLTTVQYNAEPTRK